MDSVPPQASPLALLSFTPTARRTCGRDRRARRRRVVGERRGQRDDLERRAGRLRGRDRQPGEREHAAVLGADHGHAAQLAAQRLLHLLLEAQPDRGVDGAPGTAGDAADHAVPEAQRGAAAAAQAGVVDALQAGRRFAGPAAECRRSRRPWDRSPAGGRRRRRSRRGAVGGRSCGSPSRPCAGRAAAARAPGDPALAVLVLGWKTSVPLRTPKSFVVAVTGTAPCRPGAAGRSGRRVSFSIAGPRSARAIARRRTRPGG